MNAKKIIGIGILTYLALNYVVGSKDTALHYQLPDGRVVPETQLPALGYVKVPYQGRTAWVSAERLNQLTRANQNANFWSNLIRSVQQGAQLFGEAQEAWNALQNTMQQAEATNTANEIFDFLSRI